MFPRPSVLVVDRSVETREVLRTALSGKGAQVWEATRAEQALALARAHHPDVIVLDVEITQGAEDTVRALGDAGDGVQMVLLGTARQAARSLPSGQFVAKPYHYAPLIRKIERLLEEVQRPHQKAG